MKTSFFLAVVIAPVPFLTSYYLYTQVTLISILIDVQNIQKVVFSFEKGLNGEIHSSDSHHPIKKSPHQNLYIWS